MIKGIQPRLCELGKVKTGRKEENERTTSGGKKWRAPQKLDHFIITTLERDAKGDLKQDTSLMDRLVKEIGSQDGKLRELPIAFLSDDIDEVLLAAYVWYDGKKVAARCDGETCIWYRDSKGNPIPEGKQLPCNGEHDQRLPDGKKRFKLHGTLSFVIAAGEARWGGVYKYRTTSVITVEQLYGGLLHIQSLTGGILQGLPLRLVVRPMEVAPDGKATTVYVVHVELRGRDLSAIQQQALQLAQARIHNEKQLRAVRTEYIALLKAPGQDEPDDEQAEVAAEFQPGPENGAVVETTAVHVETKPTEPEPELCAGCGKNLVYQPPEQRFCGKCGTERKPTAAAPEKPALQLVQAPAQVPQPAPSPAPTVTAAKPAAAPSDLADLPF